MRRGIRASLGRHFVDVGARVITRIWVKKYRLVTIAFRAAFVVKEILVILPGDRIRVLERFSARQRS